jgi:hypothetical protein
MVKHLTRQKSTGLSSSQKADEQASAALLQLLTCLITL